MREGSDVTIVAFSRMVGHALAAAEKLAEEGIQAEVINLRSMRPLDTETIVDSVQKTNRLVSVEESWPFAGIGSEIAALMMEQAFRLSRCAGGARTRRGCAAALCRQSRKTCAAAAGKHYRSRAKGVCYRQARLNLSKVLLSCPPKSSCPLCRRR